METDESLEQLSNARTPTHESREGDSNVTDERDRQLQKQSSQRCSTDEGMHIDESDEQS
jgi:hypothetical protein